jgi:hypothetical protein
LLRRYPIPTRRKRKKMKKRDKAKKPKLELNT